MMTMQMLCAKGAVFYWNAPGVQSRIGGEPRPALAPRPAVDRGSLEVRNLPHHLGHAAFPSDLLHHLLHLSVLLQQSIDVLNLGATAHRDAALARTVDDVGEAPFVA